MKKCSIRDTFANAVLLGCAIIIALSIICGVLYCLQETAPPCGVVVDKTHNVTKDIYYLHIRTDEGVRQCEVGRSLFYRSKIGNEVDLSEERR